MRVDRDRIGAVEVRHPPGVARRQARRATIGSVDVEPQRFARRDVGQLADGVDRPRVGGSGDAGDRERQQPGRAVSGHGRGDGRAAEPESGVGGDDHERLGWEPEQVERPRDREVGLVGGIHPNALEQRPARRPARSEQPPEVDVAGQGEAHEVGHHAARRQQPEGVRSEPDQVAQPAHDLLFDERGERPGVPHVDALVGHLGQQLAHHRDGQRRWGEVAELARVLGVHLAAGQAIAELRQDVRDRGGGGRRGRGTAGRAEERGAQRGVRRRVAHRPFGGVVVQEVERRRPGVGAEPLERAARRALVAVADQLGLGMPVEPGQERVEVGRIGRLASVRRDGSWPSG